MRPRSWTALAAAVLTLSSLAPAPPSIEGWTPLFDGKSLDGWTVRGGTATYKVEDGAIVGTTTDSRINTFLCKGDYSDFVIEFDAKLDDTRLNSGCQVRSHVYKPGEKRPGVVYGPQCEIALNSSHSAGRFYDEARRAEWIAPINADAEGAFKDGDWNHYRIVVQGDHYRSWVNGKAASDFKDSMDKTGFIGLQVHAVGQGQGPCSVRWRNLRLRELKPGETVD